MSHSSGNDASSAISVCINGAAGRMGRRLVALAFEDPGLQLASAIDGGDFVGKDAGDLAGVGSVGIPVSSLADQAAVPGCLIDFSSDGGTVDAVAYCLANQVPLVVATTALQPSTIKAVESASQTIPVVYAPNMSMAVNLTMKLAETAARALAGCGADVDVEIIERHHRFKADAPSGTALRFGETIAQQMGQSVHQHGREGLTGERPRNEIGYHAVRVGDDPGQHTIVFGIAGELIELRVAASNRDCYASGALAAAKFLVGRPAGMYSMYDVLGLN